MAAAPVYFGTIKNYMVQILAADTTAYKELYNPPTSGGVVESICVTSDDAASHVCILAAQRSAVDYPLLAKTIPITAGTIAATPSVDLLNVTDAPWARVDANGNRVLYLDDTAVLRAKVTVATTSPIYFFLQVREV
jgi:hypothetical protein